MRKIKKLAAIIMAGAMSLTLAGCGVKDELEPLKNIQDKNSGELTELTLVLDWTPNTNHTGFYVAQNEGYYEEEVLKLI